MMMTMKSSSEKRYVLGHTEQEIRRLVLQAEIFAPAMRQLLEMCGLHPGMKVLDVGTGTGDVACLAAEVVGPTGSVIGIDTSSLVVETARTRAQTAGLNQVTFLVGDLTTLVLPEPVDAVIGRLVLLHVDDPVAVLRHVTRLIQPGGIIAFQEPDFSQLGTSVPLSVTYQQAGMWCKEAMRCAGLDVQIGPRLFSLFLQAGLPAPHMASWTPIGGGPHDLGYEVMAESVRSFLPLIVRSELATEEEVAIESLAERCEEEVVSQQGVIKGPELVSAWIQMGA